MKSTMEDMGMEKEDTPAAMFKSVGEGIKSASTSKKEARKSAGVRLKLRKSTPRPSTKGDGKKCLNASPSPSIKTEAKRVTPDEGDEVVGQRMVYKNLIADLDKVAEMAGTEVHEGVKDLPENVVPRTGGLAGEDGSYGISSALEGPGATTSKPSVFAGPPPSQLKAASDEPIMEEMTVGGEDETKQTQLVPCTKVEMETNSLKATLVNFPEMEGTPNSNLERQIVPYHFEESRDCLGDGTMEEPAYSLLHLAHPKRMH